MDLIKDLTGKDTKAYEYAASHIINTPDVEAFAELVSKDDFLFDFIKRNVAQRLTAACNRSNYRNLFKFMNIYSPYYDEFISSTLAQYSDDNTELTMINYLKNGTEAEQTYAAGYFSYIKYQQALEYLRKFAYSENTYLASNCAKALSKLEDTVSYNDALDRIKSNDTFEQYAATKFLVNYQNMDALESIFTAMKSSAMSENIAGEIPFLVPLTHLLNTKYNDDAILTFCYITNGLAELLPIANVIDFDFYGIIDNMTKSTPTGPIAVALLLAKEKFNLFVENEEYLFDEDKNTKNEVNDINILLNTLDINKYTSALYEELYEESDFIYFALELAKDENMISSLLSGNNQTVILKAMSTLKNMGKLDESYKQEGLSHINDVNIKSVALAL